MFRLKMGNYTFGLVFVLYGFLLSACDLNNSNDLPMPYHEEKNVIVEKIEYEKDEVHSIMLLHKVEDRDEPVHISLDKKQARAFEAFLPISSGQQFLIRESIITERDGSTYATYHVIHKL